MSYPMKICDSPERSRRGEVVGPVAPSVKTTPPGGSAHETAPVPRASLTAAACRPNLWADDAIAEPVGHGYATASAHRRIAWRERVVRDDLFLKTPELARTAFGERKRSTSEHGAQRISKCARHPSVIPRSNG